MSTASPTQPQEDRAGGARTTVELSRGVRRGDAVAILSRTRLEWVLADWALMTIGAATVGLYPTNSASECAYVLDHSESVLLLAEDTEQLAKVEQVRPQLPQLRDVLLFA